MDRNLKIYRASAGSGKTFTLALEYIKLLVENPYCYRNILAVTFTNKATAEMKERILSKLYGVAHNLDSAADYTEKVKQQLPHLSDREIFANAEKALRLILHDYGHFRILTIDAFFQSVLRGLAKELDLSGDVEITVDSSELLDNAVEQYIKNLEPDTPNIAQVIKYIEEKMSRGEKWRIDREVKKFAKNILSEEYQQRGEKLRNDIEESNGAVLEEYHKKITALKKETKDTAIRIGKRFIELAAGYKPTDFKHNEGGIWGLFHKMSNGEIVEFKKTRAELADKPAAISSVCPYVDEIAGLIRESVPLDQQMRNCEISLSHYHELAMLNNIAATLKEENRRENRFLISETTHLLSSMIDKNATFVFEKIGTEIEHIFIDEFQDTSRLQWTCFKVLLEEVLARGNFNLIVGDVKQSIYRWRNSDWNIMNNIGSHFRKEQTTFASQDVKVGGVTYRSTNYRSDRRIVAFNNALYREAVKSTEITYEESVGKKGIEDIKAAYEDVEQAVPAKKPEQGYAEVRLLPKRDDGCNFIERAIGELMPTLRRLFEEENISPGEITILVRYKKYVAPIVEAFNREFPGMKIVSDEAYELASSPTLRLVIAMLRHIVVPEDRINSANLVKLYNRVVLGKNEEFGNCVGCSDVMKLLPQEFCDALERIKGLPAYELIEQALELVRPGRADGEEAYIYAFLDYASQFINTRYADLGKFLEAWEDELKGKCIPAESIDSVRVMTVHKSKGLEFHTVIIPFCDWRLTGDWRSLLWCEPKEEPYNGICLLPVDGKKEIVKSIYKENYYQEFLYQIVDNLNILYVATTRAKCNLIMFSDNSGKMTNTISWLLNTVTPNLNFLEGSCYDSDAGIFTYGTIVKGMALQQDETRRSEKVCDNPFEEKATTIAQPFAYHDTRIEFRQSREVERFLATTEEEKQQLGYIAEGELMHLVLSDIERAEDLEKALNKTLTLRGLISSIKEHDKIKKLLERALANPKAAEWFNGSYRLYNERAILYSEGESRRPDRVMINGDTAIVVDYKFARPVEKHKEQVQFYMKLLREIGYRNVKGYLWYVYKNEILDVLI